MKNYYGIDFDKQREKLLKSEAAKMIIESVIEKADSALDKEYSLLKITDYMIFSKTGDRRIFEDKYFERRNDCSYISVAYWLTGDDKYKNKLIDLIFNICDEYTWCVPAHALLHDNPKCEQVVETIDLFQAETGRLMTDIAFLVGDRLPYYVNDRIEYEINRRIITPLLKREFHWQKSSCKTNWASVCAGGSLVALLGFAEEADINKVLPVLNQAIENFLSGYNDDGCCMEGGAYWAYGFGYFVIYARMMLEYTNGEVNYFNREKVKNIATFLQKTRMGTEKAISFSDSSSTFSFSSGLVSYLKSVYPDEFVLPPLKYGMSRGNVYSMKELLWFDTEYCEEEIKKETVFFKDAQWFVKHNESFSFAAKGGHNNEPHNHNDIGSFMIVTKNNDIPLTDLGNALYTKETFEREHRYKMLNNSSRGHSVPIINGEYQGAEDELFCARNVKAGEDFFEADIQDAYPKGIIKRLNRRFDIRENSIVLCDSYEFSDETKEVTERFVTWTKPDINNGYVDLQSAKIMYDKDKYDVSYSEDSYITHASTKEIKVYLIDFVPKDKRTMQFEIEIVMAD